MKIIFIASLMILIVWLIRAIRKVKDNNYPDIDDVYIKTRKSDYDKIKKVKEGLWTKPTKE